MSNKLPVSIKSVQYETLGPIVSYIHPVTITEYKTYCTLILDRGIADSPVKEMVTGQTVHDQVIGAYIETGTFDQTKSQTNAYNDALNKLDQYGFVLSPDGNLGY